MDQKTKLINRSAVRDLALHVLAVNRPHLAGKLTRVSGDFYVQAEAYLSNWIAARINNHPSVGKTIG